MEHRAPDIRGEASQGSVELVRRAFDAFNRGDVTSAAELLAEDAEWYPYLGAVDADVYRGREAILDMWRDITTHLSGLTMHPEVVSDVGDKILVGVRAQGMGAGSGAGVESRWVQLWSLRGGKIVRVEAFADQAAAMEAAGKQEE